MGFRLLLLGKSGVGKSAFGNFLLDRRIFDAGLQASPVTLEHVSVSARLCDVPVTIVDTPGLLSNDTSMLNTAIAIQDSFQICQCEPNVFLIVLELRRFTVEDTDTISLIKMIFGPRCLQHGIIIFTHEDQAANERESIENLMRNFTGQPYRKALLDECRQRYLTVNCYERDQENRVAKYRRLIQMAAEAVNNDNNLYMPDLQMYRRVLERHVREWTETRLNASRMQSLLKEMLNEERKQKWIKIAVEGGFLILGTAALFGTVFLAEAPVAAAVAVAVVSTSAAPRLTMPIVNELVKMLAKLKIASSIPFVQPLVIAKSRVRLFAISL
ncbi:hypothetical protein CHS0354_001002 [Potamilus streckersoni]|uniref:AIG1-type G domain-containing protein n=1 Tax=Potamilus streckersoni TaxID=2493646 RepID=A0AAE0T2F1_9BIVA|nr:hypothetical protein CHS0354_001002 [Potamilus streckersoni]